MGGPTGQNEADGSPEIVQSKILEAVSENKLKYYFIPFLNWRLNEE